MNKIIVPTDFTSVSEVAIRYALEIAKTLNSTVSTLHIVKTTSELNDARIKMQAQVLAISADAEVDFIARVGNIFDDIPKVAAEEQAELVVMGTHGLRGMQFIVGSHALRVISECPVPVIILQEKTNLSERLNDIIVPLDLNSETKQTLKIAGDIAERFKAHIHLLSPSESDEFLNNKILRNVGYGEGYLESRNLPYTSITTKSGPSGFVKEMIHYAQEKGIDMICILNKADENLIHAFGIDSEQKIITNEPAIPVLIMNPTAASVDDRSIFAQ